MLPSVEGVVGMRINDELEYMNGCMFYYGASEWRMRELCIQELYHNSVDTRVLLSAVVPVDEEAEEYVLIVVSEYDGYDLEVWKCNCDGSAEVMIEAPNNMPDSAVYGNMEISIDPDSSPARMSSEHIGYDDNVYDRFIEVLSEYK